MSLKDYTKGTFLKAKDWGSSSMDLTISGYRRETLTDRNTGEMKNKPDFIIEFEELDQDWVVNKTNIDRLIDLFDTDNEADLVGQRVKLTTMPTSMGPGFVVLDASPGAAPPPPSDDETPF